ncbi:MAG: glycosyltransferase family 4 protein [Candidatus Levybacteria bacterium]|nr:glycosyltransferase family 4 protein [Candidatus Levybacteria bacterium]
MNQERRSSLKVLIHSPYPIRTDYPSGVSSFIQEIIPFLEAQGCDVRTLGPTNKNRQSDRADYHLGNPVSIPVIETKIDAAVTFNKGRARQILEAVKPHIIISHEPGVPNSSHTLFSAIPKDENEKRIVPVVGQFHAGYPPHGIDALARAYTIAAKILRRPKFSYGIPTGLTMGYVNTIEKTLSGRIAVSNGTAQFWNEMFPGEYRVIYNGINVGFFNPDGPKLEKWEDGKKTIFFAGRHDGRKGLEYLLQAYASLRRVGFDALKLKLAGKGDMTERLKEIVKKEDIPDVEFLGVLSKEDLARAYRSADVVVAPSIGGEGFNRTIAEARSCGTLVVCTDIRGQNEAIGDDLYGFMARPFDSDSLATQINRVLSLPEEAAREIRVKSGQDVRERFAWKIIAGQHVAYYDEVLSKHGELPKWKIRRGPRIPLAGDVFVSDKLK